MSDSFSMRMSSDDGLAPPAEIFAVKPDRKGPKTVAILLVLGSLLMGAVAYGDIGSSFTEDLTQEDLDLLLTNVRNGGDDITDDEYQEFHDEARDSGAYAIRGWSVMVGALLVFVGGVLLFRLNGQGAKLAIGGSILAAIGGVYANWKIYSISEEMLPPSLTLAHELTGYLCGICMAICLALSTMPLLNAAANAALYPKVTLAHEEE
ncbi:MAG: hypothetical protein NZ737_02775 [Candidatus Poseidoniaceae archaeon]|nr:hypothetical protein [Candidatus Poseidoniaceae archaeon]